MRKGLTLLDLLVTLAIIILIIALLIPAVAKVRGAASRAACQNNLKQWSLAVHTREALPLGVSHTPRRTWVPSLWPYIEQGNLTFNTAQDFENPPESIPFSMRGSTGRHVKTYYCPSDTLTDQDGHGVLFQRTRGNYVAYAGVFKGYDVPLGRLSDLSQTLLFSEYLITTSHLDNDWRGDFFNDQGVARFWTTEPPNSATPDRVAWAGAGNLPGMPVIASWNQTNTARSRHGQGVNVAWCDGSVSYVTQWGRP